MISGCSFQSPQFYDSVVPHPLVLHGELCGKIVRFGSDHFSCSEGTSKTTALVLSTLD